MYPEVRLHVAGEWRGARSGETLPIMNPATGEEIGRVPKVGQDDMDEALSAADRGFKEWRRVSAFDRSKIMRKAGNLLRERADDIARILTMEQGKPLAEAKGETLAGGDIIDWFAEEARRAYGRVIPARGDGVMQIVVREPVGPVAAFTPWNFPINQAVRKVSASLATGCSVILKGPEETPASCAALVQCFLDAGVPGDVIGLIYGIPAEVSNYLIPHPVIRKVTFTGSTAIGKLLAGLAGEHMKRVTMELGGHAPAIVFKDADVQKAAKQLAGHKFRNAGQVCVSPTRFLVHDSVMDEFTDTFLAQTAKLKIGNGLDADTTMGPLAHDRRVGAVESFVQDAVTAGAELRTGGNRIGNQGYFFEPTVITNVPLSAKIMNEEPFGPIASNAVTDAPARLAEAVARDYGTPCAVIDLDRVDRNIARLQERCRAAGIANRPHIKTHKSPVIARMQRAAGATGITCQKLGEAEIFAEAGFQDILISYNILGEEKARRLARLADRAEPIVAADNPVTVASVSDAARQAGRTLKIAIECDTGRKRAGVESVADAVALMKAIKEAGNLDFAGLLLYPPENGVEVTQAFLDEARAGARALGLEVGMVSTGGTPNLRDLGRIEGTTEHRAGTYVFNDRMMMAAGAATLDDCALTIVSTVVSRAGATRGILDAGSKTLSSDTGKLDGFGLILEYPDAKIHAFAEEHGFLDLSRCPRMPEVGQVVSVVPNHVCVVVNLMNRLIATRGGEVVGEIPVEARGRIS